MYTRQNISYVVIWLPPIDANHNVLHTIIICNWSAELLGQHVPSTVTLTMVNTV